MGRYTIRETKAPANYGVSGQELTAYLEHEGQILRFEVTNKSLITGEFLLVDRLSASVRYSPPFTR